MARSFRSAGLELLRAQPWLIKPEIEALDYFIKHDREGTDATYFDLTSQLSHNPEAVAVVRNIMVKATQHGLVPILEQLKKDLNNVQQVEVFGDVSSDRVPAGAHA